MIVCAVGREQAIESENELRQQLLQHTQMLHQHDAARAAAARDLSQAR
jgi:hypothetical protein